MPIVNPSPFTPGACGQYWVSSLTLGQSMLSATLRPYDGTYVVGNAAKAKRVIADPSKDASAKAAVDGIFAQVKRLSGKSSDVAVVMASDVDPGSRCPIMALFADRSTYRIADLWSLVGSDAAVAAAYAALIAYLAAK